MPTKQQLVLLLVNLGTLAISGYSLYVSRRNYLRMKDMLRRSMGKDAEYRSVHDELRPKLFS